MERDRRGDLSTASCTDPETGGEGGYRHFPHDADVGIEAWGPSLAAAFAQAAMAMTAAITDPRRVHPRESVEIRCAAPSPELLLVEWLNELVFHMATRRMLFCAFQVSIEDGRLTARVRGEAVERTRHQPAAEVKGATYTALTVEVEDSGGCRLRCVIDV